jgi:dTDP-4-amino-4,6-dideoxygalactose transaminase
VSPRTVGIIPVHLFGLSADMDPILRVARRHGLWVVEDAACALGARYGGRHVGVFGEIGCFSFHPRKSITTGEGGMITTARDDLRTAAVALRDHGATRSNRSRHDAPSAFLLPEFPQLGYNYRMTDIQGALGCAQMDRADWLLAQRAARAREYDRILRDIEWLRTPIVPEGYVHGYQSYVTLFHPEQPTLRNIERIHESRNAVMTALEADGISTRPGTHAPVLLDYYAKKYRLNPEQFPKARAADRMTLALPLYAQLTGDDLETVAGALRRSAVWR